MILLENIDLLPLQSKLKYSKDHLGISIVFDPVRRKYIRTNPEEIVRQLWILYFLEILHINPKLIAVERSFNIHGMTRRFDLVIFDKSTTPILLAEFKSPNIPLSQNAFDQIAHYNMQLQVPYALVSNGVAHYCFQINDEKRGFEFQTRLPFA